MNKVIKILKEDNKVADRLVPTIYRKLNETIAPPMFPIFYCRKTQGNVQVDKYYHKYLSRTLPCL